MPRTYCSYRSEAPNASAHAHAPQKTGVSVDSASSQCVYATALEVSETPPDIETSDYFGVLGTNTCFRFQEVPVGGIAKRILYPRAPVDHGSISRCDPQNTSV